MFLASWHFASDERCIALAAGMSAVSGESRIEKSVRRRLPSRDRPARLARLRRVIGIHGDRLETIPRKRADRLDRPGGRVGISAHSSSLISVRSSQPDQELI